MVEDEQEPEGESLHDSEEYDSEEDESDGGHRRKKKKKDRYGGFIIDEAEVCLSYNFFKLHHWFFSFC